MIRRASSSRAFILADAMTGLMLISALATILAITVGSERKAEQRLADLRTANRLADRVLLTLQHHQPAPVLPDTTITLHPAARNAPAGFNWVTVETTVNGRRASLVGIVPITAGVH